MKTDNKNIDAGKAAAVRIIQSEHSFDMGYNNSRPGGAILNALDDNLVIIDGHD